MHLRLENFDGPLDLLLHLIKAQELNIFNIPILMITEQFLSFLKQVPELDFFSAGEYLAIAAQLIEIKANMLLPVLQKTINIEAESLDDIAEEDPRKLLVEQLLEFEALKKASEFLQNLNATVQDVFPSAEYKRREEEFAEFEHPIKGNPFDLIISLEKILLKFSGHTTPKVVVKAQKITIQQKMTIVKKQLESNELITLKSLIYECLSRYELIVMLMAVLELSKANHINIFQAAMFSEIELTKGSHFYEDAANLQDAEVPL
jgi:segregation and condensation protein A